MRRAKAFDVILKWPISLGVFVVTLDSVPSINAKHQSAGGDRHGGTRENPGR